MSRYIDSEKLIVEIERRKYEWQAILDKNKNANSEVIRNIIYEDENTLDVIHSLQQEQSKVDLGKEIKIERAILLDDSFGPMNGEQSLAIRDFARHFYELGLKSLK